MLEDLGLADSACWKTDEDDLTGGTDVFAGLGDGGLGDGDVDDTVRAEAVGGGLDVGDHLGWVLSWVLGEVDEDVTAHLLEQALLGVSAVDAEHSETHGLGVLDGEGAQAAGGTGDGDPLAGSEVGGLQGLVDGDTGTQDGGDLGEVGALGQLGGLDGVCGGVLLEGPVVRVAGQVCLLAVGLVALLAELARHAGAVKPLDTGEVADLEVAHRRALGDDDTGALVASDERELGGERPVALPGVQVCVAHPGVLDVDEDLCWLGGWHGDLLVLQRPAVGLEDDAHLLFRDGEGGLESGGSGGSERLLSECGGEHRGG